MTRNNNNKLRAAFFAALMVLWVFSGAVALGGSAAAQSNTDAADLDADENWTSGDRQWQGQELVFRPTAADPNDEDYALYSHDNESADPPQTLIRELSFQESDVDSGWYTVIDTSNLEGNYVITKGGDGFDDQVTTGDDGVEGSGSGDKTDAAVSVYTQSFNSTFAEDTVNLEENGTIEVNSNRNNYNVSVSSDDLTQTELNEVFSNADNPASMDVRDHQDDDSAVLLSGLGSQAEISANFDDSNFDEGDEPSFDFEVTDTTASDSASASVGSSVGQDASFDESIFTEERGDDATISLTTQQVAEDESINLTVTDGDTVISNLSIEPDEDGEIELSVNTYQITRSNSWSDVFETENAAEILSSSDTNKLAEDRVIDAGSYDLVASENNTDGEDDEYAISTLEITERSTDSVSIHTLPNRAYGEISTLDSLADLREDGKITETSEIAIADTDSQRPDERSDTVLIEVGASGIYGMLGDDDLDNKNINLTLTQQNPGANQDPNVENFSSASGIDYEFITDPENDTLYVATRAENFGEFDQEYEAEFNVSNEYVSNFSRDDVSDDESVSGEFSLVDREAEFDTSNGQVVVEPVSDATVSGDTTVAPGTELRVRTRASSGGDQSFLKTAETVVQDDGTFEAVFSDQDSFEDVESGTNFTASIRSQSFEDNAETDGQVGDAERASVDLSDVNAEEGDEVSSITVDSVDVPRGGFVAIHDSTLEDDAVFDSYLGSSEYLSEGESADVEVELDEPLTEETDIYAVAYEDTNDNEEFDFVDSNGDEDSDYTDENGDSVTDDASVTFDSDPGNNGTSTPTDGTPTDTATDDGGSDDGEDDQAGFGAVIALIALLGAALLAARRNDF